MASQRSPVRRLEMEFGPPALIGAAMRLGATKVQNEEQCPGTKAHEDCSSVLEELLTKLKRKAILALLNVVWTLLRPIVIPICFVAIMVLLANDVPVWEAAWLSLTAPLGMLVLFGGWGLITDPIFLRSIGLNNSGAPAGVFYKPNTELDRIMQQCNFEADKYKAPFWCINGDWSTIASEVMEDRPVQYQRMNIPHGEDVPVPVDICVQTTAVAFRESAPILVVLAGVGGDSDARYVRHMCHAATERGWMAVVILPRGLGNHKIQDVKKLFNPCDLSGMHAALSFLASASPTSPMLGVGFSMGACMYCNYLSRYQPPPQFKAAVAVCGAFKFYDFTMWHRYANVFQPLIIPAILTDLVSKYGPQLMHQLGLVGLKVLCTSDRYSQLSQRLFSRIHNVPSDYAEWQALQEPLRHRHNIKTPLLLFTAQDDPLHHVGMIAVETAPTNPNIAYYVTKTGGHVAWPTGLWPKDYSYMTGVVSRFLKENLRVRTVRRRSSASKIAIPQSMLARNIPGYKRSDSGLHMIDAQGNTHSIANGSGTASPSGNVSPLSVNSIRSLRSMTADNNGSATPQNKGPATPQNTDDTDEQHSVLPTMRRTRSNPDFKPRPGQDFPPLAADFFISRLGVGSPSTSSRSSEASGSTPSSPSGRTQLPSLLPIDAASKASADMYPRFRSHGMRRKLRVGARIWMQAAVIGVVYLLVAGVVLAGMRGALSGATGPPSDASASAAGLQHAARQPAGHQPTIHQRVRALGGLGLGWMAMHREAVLCAGLLVSAAAFSVFCTHRIARKEKELMAWLRDMEDAPRRAVWESALSIGHANVPAKHPH